MVNDEGTRSGLIRPSGGDKGNYPLTRRVLKIFLVIFGVFCLLLVLFVLSLLQTVNGLSPDASSGYALFVVVFWVAVAGFVLIAGGGLLFGLGALSLDTWRKSRS